MARHRTFNPGKGGFKSPGSHHRHWPVAQSVERRTVNAKRTGFPQGDSNPLRAKARVELYAEPVWPAIYARVAELADAPVLETGVLRDL